jgi:tRNA dimethylallyltransferase
MRIRLSRFPGGEPVWTYPSKVYRGLCPATIPRVDHPLIAILGPTGSGKSTLAIELAGDFHGEIVNCDSLQLYRGFDVGTAKTPPSARRGIPHHLFDVIHDVKVAFSAGDYARQARETIAEITARDRVPLVVGGTGFYLRALLEGLPDLPGRDESLRARLSARELRRPGSLHRLLRRLDPPAAARIHSNDTQKLIRALEIRMLTSATQPSPASARPLEGYKILKLGLDPDRAQLFAQLDARVITMFNSGLIEEVQSLRAQGATGEEKPFESLGYKQTLQLLRAEITLDQAIASTQLETRQYAKRQWTWFRRDPEIHWLKGFGNDPEIVKQAKLMTAALC